jgi:hypothetical protein
MQMVRDQLGRYVHPVHRLDGGTSGCLVFAFDSSTCAMLQAAMQSRKARKVYLAHTRGDAGWIRDLTVDRAISDEKKKVKRSAITHFDCLASCSDDLPERSSLIRCELSTGRWHQIRKHLNGLSHPVLGDAKHGDSRLNRWWRQEYEFRHLGLHCHELHLEYAALCAATLSVYGASCPGGRLHARRCLRSLRTPVRQELPCSQSGPQSLMKSGLRRQDGAFRCSTAGTLIIARPPARNGGRSARARERCHTGTIG